jgi:hypothetical protein
MDRFETFVKILTDNRPSIVFSPGTQTCATELKESGIDHKQ